ncbi:MAG: response regulator [Acidobacteria bacterium]|nr:response regulator [Acidobacteriota bacterium]
MKTILLVDDDEDVLASVKRVLGDPREGWVCHTARDGQEAMTKLAEEPVDLLVTDLRMPDMDGVDLLAAVQREYRGLPVIILSGLSDVRAVAPGAFADLPVLQKPVSTAKLKQLVRQELERWQAGHTRDISLSSLLLLMRIETKTCMIQVTDGNRWGELQLSEGRVVGARLDDEGSDEDPVAVMLGWDRVSVDVFPAHWSDTHPVVADPSLEEPWETSELRSGTSSTDAPSTQAIDPEILEMVRRAAPSTGALALLLADRAKGRVVAHLQPLATDRSIDLELGAAAEALALQTSLADRLEEGDEVEELAFTTRDHCEVLRPVAKHPDLFLYGLFERSQFNVAMASLAMRSLETGLEELEPKGPGEA